MNFWLLYQLIKASALNTTGTGTAVGDATASATGASLFDSTGAATGDAVASAVGESLFDSTGAAAGDAVASAEATSLFDSTGTAIGDAVCSGFIEDATPPAVIAPTVEANIGVGRAAWRNWYHSTLPKKKRKLVDELDEMIAALQERIVPVEVAGFDEEVYQRTLRVSQELAARQDLNRITDERIAKQIARLKDAIEEIDDEEAIILAIS